LGHRQVLIEHDDSRYGGPRGDCSGRNDGASQALGKVRDQTADEGDTEPGRRVGAVQAEQTPAATSGDERRSKLVTQPKRSHHFDVSGAGLRSSDVAASSDFT
jgi:hypothetical protein